MSQAVNHTASHTASRAVELLIVDEPSGLDARMRAELEHAPALRTIGEDDLARGGPVPAVALVPVDGAGAEAGCARIAALREGRPWLRVLAVFRTLDASAMNRLIAAGADAFVGCGTPADEVCASVLALAKGAPPTPSAAAASACPPHGGSGHRAHPARGRGSALPQCRLQQQGGRPAALAERPDGRDPPAEPAPQDADRPPQGSRHPRPPARSRPGARHRGAAQPRPPHRPRRPGLKARSHIRPARTGRTFPGHGSDAPASAFRD